MTIHEYAVEAELWTTLAINSWAVITATIYLIGKALDPKAYSLDKLANSAVLAFAVLAIVAGYFFLAILLFDARFLGGPEYNGGAPLTAAALMEWLITLSYAFWRAYVGRPSGVLAA